MDSVDFKPAPSTPPVARIASKRPGKVVNESLGNLFCHLGHLPGEEEVVEGQTKEEGVEEVLGEEAVVVLTWEEGEVEQTLVVEEAGLRQVLIQMMEVEEG